MTANLGEGRTEPIAGCFHNGDRDLQHGAVSVGVAASGLCAADAVQDGLHTAGECSDQIRACDTSANALATQAAPHNLLASTAARSGPDGRLEASEEDYCRDREVQDDSDDEDGTIAEVGSQPPTEPPPPPPPTQPQHTAHQVASEGWESFLPQRHLRVLLVEDDDSTRHVVGALLRNCSYEVTSAGNGLQAWELLETPSNHFDLVLTDVVMPCLSGVGLLSRIMSLDPGKRVPVVMMSSHDSMDFVFRCLSKGAADYLVKPVRKNELKNLWQHVWRKCHSSSGSGSGSGSQTGKVMRAKSRAGSGNNSGSNDGSDNGSSGLNLRGGSDNGSGTQSSWTKRAMEVESPQQGGGHDPGGPSHGISPRCDFPPPQARVEDSQGQRPSKKEEGHESQGKPSESESAHDVESVKKRATLNLEGGMGDAVALLIAEAGTVEDAAGADKCQEDLNVRKDAGVAATPSYEQCPEPMDLTATISRQSKADAADPGEATEREGEMGASNSPVTKKTGSDSNSLPTLELSLKRPRAARDHEGETDDRRVLRQSGGSAFSRYSTSVVNMPQQFTVGNGLLNGLPAGFGGQSISHGVQRTTNPSLLHIGLGKDGAGSCKGSELSTQFLVHPSMSNNCNGQDMSSSIVGPSGQDGFLGTRHVKDEAVSLVPGSGQAIPVSGSLPPSGMTYDGLSAAFGPSMHPGFYPHPGSSPWTSGSGQRPDREMFDRLAPFHEHGQLSHPQAHRYTQHHGLHQHHPDEELHHHHHHYSIVPQPPTLAQQPDDKMLGCAGARPGHRCGSSNVAGHVPDGCHAQSGSSNCHGSNGNLNGSVNGSASGSNNAGKGGNGDSGNNNGNGDSGTNNVTHGNSGSGNGNGPGDAGVGGTGNGNGGGSSALLVGSETTKFSRREAALNKFRQKRKERCFEKKVRYQSRKRLAEQRPRIRGQFVRQAVYETAAGELDQ